MGVTLKIELTPTTDEKIKSRPVKVVEVQTGKEKTVECVKGDGTFDAEPGQHGYAVPTGDTNDKGTGPPGDQFSWTVPMDVPPPEPELPAPVEGAPPAPVIMAITQVKSPGKGATAHPAAVKK